MTLKKSYISILLAGITSFTFAQGWNAGGKVKGNNIKLQPQKNSTGGNGGKGVILVKPGGTTPAAPTTGNTTNTNTGNSKNSKMGGGTDNNTNNNTNINTGGNIWNNLFSPDEAGQAIKQALTTGINAGVSKVSVVNGFLNNAAIKIPFPQEASVVENTLRSFGMGSLIDNIVTTINHAAENAASQALPIFVNAITKLSITDAVNIVTGTQQDAATQFLQRTTTEQLVSAFKPSIQSALDKTLATKYWSTAVTQYNRIPFISQVNTDLPDYVTRKAVSGLFYMIGQEEIKIRQNPLGQSSNVIQKVFGSVKAAKK